MLDDVRYGLRLLRKSPGFTAVAVLTLGLAIGANTAVFSIVQGVLLRPLPYRDPARLVAIWGRSLHEAHLAKIFLATADFEEFQRRSRSFDSLAAVSWALGGPTTLTGRGPARHIRPFAASASLFDTLGVTAALGRTFTAEDADRGCSVVLTHSFWSTTLGADPHIVGQDLALSGTACRVVGVMPREFAFYPPVTDLWRLDRHWMPKLTGIFGRLKPGVTPRQAQQELEAMYRAMHPDDEWKTFVPAVYDLRGEFTFLAGRNLRTTLWILLGAVGLVLLIACVNIANLLLGRGLVRGREFAIRAALGGGRARLFRQLITEGLLLAVLGGAAGVAVAYASILYFRSVNPIELPVGAEVTISLPVLAFALGASAATAILFGLAPAWRGSRMSLGGRGTLGGRQHTVKLLVAAEMALSVVLLAGAGLLIESVVRMGNAPLGFEPDRLYATRLTVPKDPRFYERLEAKIAAIPGVKSASLASNMPPFDGSNEVLDVAGEASRDRHDVVVNSVSAGYFRTLEVALVRGRLFDAHDLSGAEPVAVVNEALAREYFGGGDALGRRVRVEKGAPYATIVGVVADEKHTNVMQEMNWLVLPILFRPLPQHPAPNVSIAMRTVSDAIPIAAALRREVASLDPNAVIDDPESVRHKLATFMAYPRFRAVMLGVFAGFALLLAAVGLHAVLAQLVSQRTQEIGVRMALGARPGDVVRMVVRQGGAPVMAGLAAGLAAAFAWGRYLSSVLYGVGARDPLTLAGVAALLLIVAGVATAMPARRAARTDPMEALRQE